MTFVEATTWLALVTTAIAALIAAGALLDRRLRPWADRALTGALLVTSLPLGALVIAFLTGELAIFYVWQNVTTTSPWWLRLAGLWGGQAGTFLLWAWMVLAATAVERRLAPAASWPRARVVLTVLAALLLVPPILLGLGQATSALGLTAAGTFQPGAPGPGPLDVRPQGEGLNPLLDSPYMAIHPPIEFLAYALTAIPFAYVVTGMATGTPWRQPARRWAKAAWVASATALALGALWAYLVLSFGGYWAWDPVETAALLPFLALTVFLHAEPVSRGTGHLGLLAPASAGLAMVLAIFATFTTRSGLWSSVHAFLPLGTSVALQDPGARLLAAVTGDATARFTTGLLLAVTGLFTASTWRFHARDTEPGPDVPDAPAWQAPLFQALAALYALVGLAGLIATETTVRGLHGLMLLVGAGRPLVGTVVLLALAAAPLLVGLLRSPEDTPLSPQRRQGQLTLAAYLLSLTLVGTLLLLVLGVNGYDRVIFDARAPYLAAPILALIALTFLPGRANTRIATAGIALALAVAVKLITGSWAWAALPITGLVAAAGLLDLTNKLHPTGTWRQRLATGLTVTSGVLALVHWASPGRMVLGGVALASPTWYVPVGLVAGTLAVLAPLLQRHGVPRWIGPAAGLLGLGYGLGALLALAAALLDRGTSFGPGARPATTTVPLVHVAVAVLVLGVALSTYGQAVTTFPEPAPLERGVPQTVGDYELELVDGRVIQAQGAGPPEAVEAIVHVRKGGAFLSEETLRLEHSFNTGFTGAGSYVPEDSPTVRGPFEDLQLDADPADPLSIRVGGTNTTWFVAGASAPAQHGTEVVAVSLGVATTPGINLVWGGISLLLVAAGARFVAERRS